MLLVYRMGQDFLDIGVSLIKHPVELLPAAYTNTRQIVKTYIFEQKLGSPNCGSTLSTLQISLARKRP